MTTITTTIETTDIESRIIEVARALFIEKGYAETSMSDIAAQVGINRPTLHYYFRTKDRLFSTVFGLIIEKVVPQIQDILLSADKSVEEQVSKIVDAYYEVFKVQPGLPLFVAREVQRDADFVLKFIRNTPAYTAFMQLSSMLQAEMDAGKIRRVPPIILFYNFYGLLTFPIMIKNMVAKLEDCSTEESLSHTMQEWKPYIVSQMSNLLTIK